MPPEFEDTYSEFKSSILHDSLKAVVSHWRESCQDGHFPGWQDIRPSVIKKHLSIVWFYEYDPLSDDFLGCLAGAAIAEVADKSFKGTKLSELRPVTRYPRALIRAKRVINEPALYRGIGTVYNTVERQGVGERVVMPISAKGNRPAGIFGATAFKRASEWKDGELPIEHEQELWFSLRGSALEIRQEQLVAP